MVSFAGWTMPVQYKDMGIAQSHLHTRSAKSILDIFLIPRYLNI